MRICFVFLTCLLARAEFLHVEVVMKDMDCASCSDSLGKAFERIRGVKHVDLSMEKKTVILELADQNRVTLEQVWDTVKRIGFTPGETSVVVRGEVKGSSFKVNDKTIVIEGRAAEGENVELRGIVTPPTNPRDSIVLRKN